MHTLYSANADALRRYLVRRTFGQPETAEYLLQAAVLSMTERRGPAAWLRGPL